MKSRKTDLKVDIFCLLLFTISFIAAILGIPVVLWLSPLQWVGLNLLFTLPIVSVVFSTIISFVFIRRLK